MKKQPDISLEEAQGRADTLLADIIELQDSADRLLAERREAVAKVILQYDLQINPLMDMVFEDEKELKHLMKSAKLVIFDGRDIVYLDHGNLLYSKGDKVTIPRDALDKCERQGFVDVIKVVKSLDREAIDKWTDEKLFLIGAERKPVETFNFEVKEKRPGHGGNR
jgi:hypothetical protein